MRASIRLFRKIRVYPRLEKTLFFLLFGLCAPALAAETAQVTLTPYPLSQNGRELNPGDEVGKTKFLFSKALSSEDSSFGGFSGLTFDASGRQFYVLSDKGRLFTMEPSWEEGKVVAGLTVKDARWLNGRAGHRLPKDNRDSEAIAKLRDGKYAVAFEGNHRVLAYDFRKSEPVPKDLMLPQKVIEQLQSNQGIEAMVEVEKGKMFTLAEAPGPEERIQGWVWRKGKILKTISYQADEDFRPTDATQLPNGDILVLERSYSIMRAAQRARVVRVPHMLRLGAKETTPEEIARFGWHSRIDNMEGLAVLPNPDGSLLLLLMSDHNFNVFQTIILVGLEYRP